MATCIRSSLFGLGLGLGLGLAPSAQALVIFDNSNNLSRASSGQDQSLSGNNAFVATSGTGTGAKNGVAIPLSVTKPFYINDASLQISANNSDQRTIGFYLYQATPSGTEGNNANKTQLFTPVGGPIASATFNFTTTNINSAYSTFNFYGTNIGTTMLKSGTTYLLVAGNLTTTNGKNIQFGSASTAETPTTTNLISWNTSGSATCTVATCKTDSFTTNNGGQSFSSNFNNSTFWKINGTQAVPAPLPLVGAGMAFGYSRSLRRRLGQQASG